MEQEILALFEKVLSRKVGFHDELIESDILDSILASIWCWKCRTFTAA